MNARTEVLVGVDGSAASSAAVAYAVRVAEQANTPVRLVHAVPTHLPMPIVADGIVVSAGRDLLEQAATLARMSAPGVEVRTSLLSGARGHALVEAASSAWMVVLGRSDRVSFLPSGSTAAAVVAATTCPVRIVPADWSTRAPGSGVVVAAKDVDTSHGLVLHAFELARGLGEPVVLLHAWGLPAGYEAVIDKVDVEAWNRNLVKEFRGETEGISERFPDVPFEVRVVHGRTATALQEASTHAALLVLGRPGHPRPIGHLGGTTRLLLNVSECVVEIGPAPRPAVPELDLSLEEQGGLVR